MDLLRQGRWLLPGLKQACVPIGLSVDQENSDPHDEDRHHEVSLASWWLEDSRTFVALRGGTRLSSPDSPDAAGTSVSSQKRHSEVGLLSELWRSWGRGGGGGGRQAEEGKIGGCGLWSRGSWPWSASPGVLWRGNGRSRVWSTGIHLHRASMWCVAQCTATGAEPGSENLQNAVLTSEFPQGILHFASIIMRKRQLCWPILTKYSAVKVTTEAWARV